MENFFGGFKRKDKHKSEEGYEYFRDRFERHDIYEFAKELTIYLEENGIKDVILIDRSARPAWVAIDEYWKINYPDQQRPSIHFVNPKILEINYFLKKESIGNAEVNRDLEKIATTGRSPIFDRFNKQIRTVADEFIEKYKIPKDGPVLVFDTCSHTGETLNAVTNMLGMGGYDVRVLTANDADRIHTEKRLDRNAIMTSCYPFGTDSGVEKGDKITSFLDEGADREGVVASRQEIRKIIRDQGK